MGLIALVCPQCSAKLDVEDGREFYFCQYCGCKIVHEKKIVELSGTVNVAGMATEDSLLDKAIIQLKNRQFKAADGTFERVLDINPRNAEAYLGKLMVELEIDDVEDLPYYNYPLDGYINYQNVIKYGNSDQKKELQSVNEKIITRLMDRIPLPDHPGKAPRANKYIWLLSCGLVGLLFALLLIATGLEALEAVVFGVIGFFVTFLVTRKKFSAKQQELAEYLYRKEIYDDAMSDPDKYRERQFRIRYK